MCEKFFIETKNPKQTNKRINYVKKYMYKDICNQSSRNAYITKRAKKHIQVPTSLGSIVSTTSGTEEDIVARKRKVQHAFPILRPVWKSRTLRTA